MSDSPYANFHQALHAWYQHHGRHDLPWRNTPDPYAIWISEVMLQQTQVETVLSRYYLPFLKRFPTAAALAKATRDEVMKAWQGLGYYRRAVHLHEAAKQAAERFPATVEELMALPGVGRNTAHAVAAFSYHTPVPVMEANVKRVISRIFVLSHPAEKELWEKAALLLDTENPFDYNQAMMDVGAMICTPKRPACMLCPAHAICLGKESPEAYPARKAAAKEKIRKKTIVVAYNRLGQVYAVPRESNFLHGLYHFIELEKDAQLFELEENIYPLRQGCPLGSIRQVYSHFTLEAEVLLLEVDAANANWYGLEQLRALPMSRAELKILTMLESSPQLQGNALATA